MSREAYNLARDLGTYSRKGDHRVTVEELLRDALSRVAKDAPLPWQRDSEGLERSDSTTFNHYFVGTEAPNRPWVTLFDTSQSTAVLIEEDYDEDYHNRWDETARRTTGLVLAAVNTLPLMLKLLDATRTLASLRPENWREDDELVAAYGTVDSVLGDLTDGASL